MGNLVTTTDLAVLIELIDVTGLLLLDVGCGDGAFSCDLVSLGATVIAIDPDPVQITKNHQAAPMVGLRFKEAAADRLPMEDASVDGVFFRRSLHHVPSWENKATNGCLPDIAADWGTVASRDVKVVVREAHRVLKRDQGFLFVIEPREHGSYSALMALIRDERPLWRFTAEQFNMTARKHFSVHRRVRYTIVHRFRDFEDFMYKITGKSYELNAVEDIDQPQVRSLFTKGCGSEGYTFEHNMVADFYGLSRVALRGG